MPEDSFRDYEDGVSTSVSTIVRDTAIGNVADGNWHHVALVLDRTNQKARFYLDKNLVGEEAEDFTLASEVSTKSASYAPLKIGDGWGGNNSSAWQDLSVDELRITKRALATEEFLTAGPVPPPRGLLLMVQ